VSEGESGRLNLRLSRLGFLTNEQQKGVRPVKNNEDKQLCLLRMLPGSAFTRVLQADEKVPN